VSEKELPATRAGGSLTKFLTKRQYLDGEKNIQHLEQIAGEV
jgi:hypothetical protein